jgi:hypothetical protein
VRAREFISEFHNRNHNDALPNATTTGSINSGPDGPGNGYFKYRLGIAAAGSGGKNHSTDPSSPNYEHKYTDGPTNDKMIMIGYTDGDQDIIDVAHKKMGYKQTKLTSLGSKESEHVHSVSPMNGFRGYPR